MGLFSTCGGKLVFHLELWRGSLGPLELHEGSQASFQVLRGNSGLLSWHWRRKGPHLALMGESRGLSLVAAGGLWFLSRYYGELREPLVLYQQSQVSIRVVRASVGVLWSYGRGIRPHFRSLPLLNNLCMWLISCVQFFVTSWTVAHQAPLSMGSSRQEYWSRFPSGNTGAISLSKVHYVKSAI